MQYESHYVDALGAWSLLVLIARSSLLFLWPQIVGRLCHARRRGEQVRQSLEEALRRNIEAAGDAGRCQEERAQALVEAKDFWPAPRRKPPAPPLNSPHRLRLRAGRGADGARADRRGAGFGGRSGALSGHRNRDGRHDRGAPHRFHRGRACTLVDHAIAEGAGRLHPPRGINTPHPFVALGSSPKATKRADRGFAQR